MFIFEKAVATYCYSYIVLNDFLRGNYMDYEELKLNALEFEEKAKAAKKEEKFDEAAQYHLKAAKFYNKIGEDKNCKFNYANYHSTIGRSFLFAKNYLKSANYLKEAENLFIELNIKDPAFYCALDRINSLYHSLNNSDKKGLQEFTELLELFFARYKNFDDHERYLESKIKYCITKSNLYRNEKKLELAENWAFDGYELSNKLYKDHGERYKSLNLHNDRRYWSIKGRRLKTEKKFENAAESFKKAGDIALEIDAKYSYDDYKDYHYCVALLNKKNKEIFIQNIDKAIEYAELIGYAIDIDYFNGFKYENLVKFAPVEEKLELLEKAKTHYYQSNNESFARGVEYFIFYNMSKKYLKEGEYEKSLSYFDKTIEYSKYVGFPNLVPSKDILINERNLHEFYLHISNGSFLDASEMIKKWLNNEDIKNTRKYIFYKISGFCCEIISRKKVNEEDLFALGNYLNFIYENRLGLNLYHICSLVYSYASLFTHEIKNNEVFKNIGLEIISRFTTEDAAKYVKESLKVKSAVEEREWLLQLPPLFAEKFDKSVFHLENSVEEFKNGAFMDFYKLIENFIKVIVEFNAQILWGDDFERKIEEKIAETNPNSKPFGVFALGDLVNSLKILKDENSKYCITIPDSTLDLINKHVPTRNQLSHELETELTGINILKDATEIIYNLLPSFPTLIEIKNTERKPSYSAEILWNQYPKRVTVNHEQNLETGKYYSDPFLNVVDSNVYPEIMISK